MRNEKIQKYSETMLDWKESCAFLGSFFLCVSAWLFVLFVSAPSYLTYNSCSKSKLRYRLYRLYFQLTVLTD